MLVAAFLRGLGLGASLIIAIGAQNAFVLRQGLKREHRFLVALACTLCDAALIGLGAAGFGSLIAHNPRWIRMAAWAGALFLFFYGARALRIAWKPAGLDTAEAPPAPIRAVLVTLLGLSLLNPHVYLDTVVLVGGLSAQYSTRPRFFFALGAVTASLLWFFSLAFGASALAPVFRRPLAWRVLDTGIGLVMWSIALGLLLGVK